MRGAWTRVVAAIGLGALAACGGSSTPSTTVTGTRLVTYWKDDGSVVVQPPTDLAQTAVSALVQEGGGWREAPGTIAPDGTFTIPDVGTGSYLLRVVLPNTTPRYVAETSRRLDLGTDLVGRPSRTMATQATPVTFSSSGLEPWTATDGLALFTTGGRLNTPIGGAPLPGATDADFTLDFYNRPLPEAGDLGWVLQTTHPTLAGVTSSTAIVRSAAVTTTASLPDGQSLTLPLALSTPPQGSLGIDLRRSQYAALLPELAPGGAPPPPFTVAVRAVPRDFSVYYAPFYASVLSATLSAGTDDVNLGTLSYARPFPSWFTEVRAVEWLVTMPIPAALGASATSITFLASRVERVAGASSVIVPTLGPTREPRIGSLDARQPQAGVGLTPTLSWSRPALGAAGRYAIAIFELGSTPVSRASLLVTGTSIALPPSLLEAGKVYVASITAISEPGWDPAAPYRFAQPRELVPSITAPFSP